MHNAKIRHESASSHNIKESRLSVPFAILGSIGFFTTYIKYCCYWLLYLANWQEVQAVLRLAALLEDRLVVCRQVPPLEVWEVLPLPDLVYLVVC
ncbi:hypothetical protein D3C75_1105730 [compost metagenome]